MGRPALMAGRARRYPCAVAVDRRLLDWGVFLVLMGAIPLGVSSGVLDADVTTQLWRLWPLVLVGIGLGLLLRLTPLAGLGGVLVAGTLGLALGGVISGGISGVGAACIAGGGGGEVTQRSGEAASGSFGLQVEMTCGDLEVTRAPGMTWTVEARHASGQAPVIEGSPQNLRVTPRDPGKGFFPLVDAPHPRWTVSAPTATALSVAVTLNAAHGSLDLGGGAVTSVSGTLNASDARIDLSGAAFQPPASLSLTFNASSGWLALPAGSMTGSLTLNAASLELCVAPGAALRIEESGTLSSVDLGGHGLEHTGNRWQTPGFETAPARVELNITSTVSSVTLDRSGGCR